MSTLLFSFLSLHYNSSFLKNEFLSPLCPPVSAVISLRSALTHLSGWLMTAHGKAELSVFSPIHSSLTFSLYAAESTGGSPGQHNPSPLKDLWLWFPPVISRSNPSVAFTCSFTPLSILPAAFSTLFLYSSYLITCSLCSLPVCSHLPLFLLLPVPITGTKPFPPRSPVPCPPPGLPLCYSLGTK